MALTILTCFSTVFLMNLSVGWAGRQYALKLTPFGSLTAAGLHSPSFIYFSTKSSECPPGTLWHICRVSPYSFSVSLDMKDQYYECQIASSYSSITSICITDEDVHPAKPPPPRGPESGLLHVFQYTHLYRWCGCASILRGPESGLIHRRAEISHAGCEKMKSFTIGDPANSGFNIRQLGDIN